MNDEQTMTPEQMAVELHNMHRLVRQLGQEIHAWRRWHRNFRVHELVGDDDVTEGDYADVLHERSRSESLCVALRRFPFKFYRDGEI